MSKKIRCFKEFLVAVVGAAFVLIVTPVSAAEMANPADVAQLENSISVAGECDCVQDWALMSRRYDQIDNSTHTVTGIYYSECMHGLKKKNEVTRENHSYKPDRDEGHISSTQNHIWQVTCVCGDKKYEIITCWGEINGGSHSSP